MRLVLQKVAWRVNYFRGLFWGVLGGGRIRVMADMKLIIPKFVGSMSRAGVKVNDYSVSDIRNLQRALKAIDPKLRTQLLREAKEPAKPIQSAVKSAIPSTAPLSGMNNAGRLNWQQSVNAKGKVIRAKDVSINFRTASSGKSLTTTLVRVKVASPAVVMADMAGKSGRFEGKGYKGTGRTREYNWKDTTRSHRVDGQGLKKPNRVYKFRTPGEAMIAGLGGRGSRFVWPAAERGLPGARREVEQVIAKFIRVVNQKGL